jgi:NAD(P)-dependent dehydrogenase (short-subunit alcohol dehydrogenase family)
MVDSMNGKTVLVTGANSGIGKVTALELARARAQVVMLCRNKEKGEAARREIIDDTGHQAVELMIADLASVASIREFAAEFKRTHNRLHVLVNNAGLFVPVRRLTVDGFESTFAINHLGEFLLTDLLLDLLRASAPARIVNVSSRAHFRTGIDFDDLQGERKYRGFKAYARSKLANVLFTYELARRLEGTGVTANCLHPGVVRTNFGRVSDSAMGWGARVAAPFMISPEKGAKTSIYLASSPEVEGVTGKYFVKSKPARSSALSYNVEAARRLWDVSARLTGVAVSPSAARAAAAAAG